MVSPTAPAPALDPRSRLTLPNGGQPIKSTPRPSPTITELEASLEAHFNRSIRLLGGRAVKLAPTEKGLPDRLVLLPGGRVFLVELKAVGGRISAAQDLWHERAGQLGTRVHVLTGRGQVDRWVNARASELHGIK